MYQIYVRSNVHLCDDDPVYEVGQKNRDGEYYDENIVEMKEHEDGSCTQLKIKLKEMTANEAIEYLSDLMDNWCRVSVEWEEV